MGSWNQTCGISRLHICPDDPVVGFVLFRQPKVYNTCYSNFLYEPLPLPMFGTYADYGRVETKPSANVEILEGILRNNLVELPVGENPCHDIVISKEGFTIDFMYEACHERRLFVNYVDSLNKNKLEIQVEIMLVHGKIWDSILESYSFNTIEKAIDSLIEDYIKRDPQTSEDAPPLEIYRRASSWGVPYRML